MANNEVSRGRRSYEKVKEIGGAVVRGPRSDIRDIIRIPFIPIVGIFKWVLFILGVVLAFGLLFVGGTFIYNTYTQGVADVVLPGFLAPLAKIPGLDRVFTFVEDVEEVVTDPASVVVKSSNSQWKSTVEGTEVDKELGLEFAIGPTSDKNLYFTNEKIKARADLVIKIPKVEGEDVESSVLTLGCIGETSGENKEGIVKNNQRAIRKGEVSFMNMECEFPENTFEVNPNLIQAEDKLQNLKIKFFVDYPFSSFTFWPVYTKNAEKIREDRTLGNDPFEGIKDNFIRDRERGVVSSQASKAPMRIVLGGIGQPYSDKSGGNEGYNFMGVSFEEYARYKTYALGFRDGTVKEIKDIRIRVPNNFALNTEEGDFIESEEELDEVNRNEYKIKQEKLTELNSRCERLGIKKEEIPGYLSQECFDALKKEEFATSTSFRVDFLETEILSVSEITARTDYIYEVYDTVNVGLRKPSEVKEQEVIA